MAYLAIVFSCESGRFIMPRYSWESGTEMPEELFVEAGMLKLLAGLEVEPEPLNIPQAENGDLLFVGVPSVMECDALVDGETDVIFISGEEFDNDYEDGHKSVWKVGEK